MDRPIHEHQKVGELKQVPSGSFFEKHNDLGSLQ